MKIKYFLIILKKFQKIILLMMNTSYNFNISEPDENVPEEKKEPQIANENISTVNKAVVEISSSQKYKEESFKSFPNSKNIFIKIISKNFSSGSLTSSIFNLCILSLGTGSLALPQKIGYMSLFFSPIIIILSGLVNYWTLNILSNASKKYNLNSYEAIVQKLFGNLLSIFLGVIMCITQFGTIILYQVILYKLLGGVINEIFNLGFTGVEDFALNSFWNEFKIKFIICYLISILILTPLCLLKNISKMRYASMFGIISLFFLIFIIVLECPFYIYYNFFEKNNKKIKLNYFDVLSGFKDDIKILQAISTLFYAFSCHVGVFPVLNTLKNPTQKRIQLLFKKSISLDIICYLIIGISGYLTQPENTPDLIIERKKIFDNDFLMIIGQICFIFTLIAKICANYNALRICIINLFNKNKSKNQISNKINLILTTCCLIITTLISIIFQSISSYISLIGGFCSVIISILIPGFIYIKGIQELKINNKTIFAGIIIIILTLIGFTNGILTIKNVVNRK